MSSRQIYALLVGIDKYQSPVPPLDGCVNDMRAMRDFLKRYAARHHAPLHLQVLENDQATRLNIVNKFETHLTQAGPNDVAFFYYSGHGSQEHAHEVFWSLESDRRNETLVCYDSRMPDGMDLADKELATLLDLVAKNKPHILTIVDACNSGSGTRGFAKVRSIENPSDEIRTPEAYILPRNVKTERGILLTDQGQKFVVPNPRHISLSAAHSFQLAKETYLGGSPRGVFTFSLIEILEKTVGSLTYNDLIRRVRSLVTQRTYDQYPQLFAPVQDDQHLVFLNGEVQSRANYFALTFDPKRKWTIDAGMIHGIAPPGFSGERTLLSVFSSTATEAELDNERMSMGLVKADEVFGGSSNVSAIGDLRLDQQQTYRTRLYDTPVKAIQVAIMAGGTEAKAITQATDLDEEARSFVEFVSDPSRADYLVHVVDQQYVLTRATDRVDQLLVPAVQIQGGAGARQVVDYLEHLAKWTRLHELNSGGSTLPDKSIDLQILPPNQETPFMPDGNGVYFTYQGSAGASNLPMFRVRAVNRSRQRLYCSILYLGSQFQVVTNMIPSNGIWLEPGQEVWALEGKTFTAQVSDSVFAMGRAQVVETFKVIFSTMDFDASLLEMPALGLPRQNWAGRGAQNTRTLIFGNRNSSLDSWNANEEAITIQRIN